VTRRLHEARALRLALAVLTHDEKQWLSVLRETWAATAEPSGLHAIWYLFGTGYDRVGRLVTQIEKDRDRTISALREQLALLEEDE
jgi:hypothetical protein